ncbi:hypothetical protein FOWG_16913 [Fusarium oxysporum f. sp. lycopersici MN25]|nr:hypothetical protein FOWG_16913 [Fusarium oxysporum f. sp. lycopersici MN25]
MPELTASVTALQSGERTALSRGGMSQGDDGRKDLLDNSGCGTTATGILPADVA